MRPILFTVPVVGFDIHSYGLMLALGTLIGLQASMRLARRRGLNEQMIVDVTMVAILCGIVGARIFYVIQFYGRHFAGRGVLELLKVWHGGLVFYGGVIFAALSGYTFARRRKMTGAQVWDLADCAAVGVMLGLALGRVGCFLNGCCFGRVTDSFVGVTFPRGCAVFAHQVDCGLVSPTAMRTLPVIPTQPISSLAAFAIFLVLYFVIARRARMKGSVAHWALLLSPVGRFTIELFRADPLVFNGALGYLSAGQAVSLVTFTVAVPFYVVRWRRRRMAAAAAGKGEVGRDD